MMFGDPGREATIEIHANGFQNEKHEGLRFLAMSVIPETAEISLTKDLSAAIPCPGLRRRWGRDVLHPTTHPLSQLPSHQSTSQRPAWPLTHPATQPTSHPASHLAIDQPSQVWATSPGHRSRPQVPSTSPGHRSRPRVSTTGPGHKESQASRYLMEARTLALISQRQQEQKQRRTSKNPCSRWQNNTPEGKKRRANRISMYKMRKAASQKDVAPRPKPRKKAPALHSLASAICGKDKNMPVACCGRRKAACHCYDCGTGLTLRKACKKAVINALVRRVRKSPIQTWRDTADMSEYAKQIKCKKLKHLFPTAFMWRHFSNKHLWEALVKNGAVKHDGPPSWALVRSTLEIFVLHNQPVHGGFFYSGNILRKYRFCTTGTWTD